jgi:hypothetical protein
VSDVKHTPGPWFVVRMRGWSGLSIARHSQSALEDIAGDYPIANMCEGSPYWENKFPIEANARLIAAAPDLLEALKAYMHAMEGFAEAVRAVTGTAYPWEAQDIERAKALAALSKAEGK